MMVYKNKKKNNFPLPVYRVNQKRSIHSFSSTQNAGVDIKGTAGALLDKGPEKSPTKVRQPRKVDLRARYWAFLFENLRRAVDEIYVTCESDQSVLECKVSFFEESPSIKRRWSPCLCQRQTSRITGFIPLLYYLLAHRRVNPALVQPHVGSLTLYSSFHILLSLLPRCIMLSMNVAMVCGQHRRPVPNGKVRMESVPQRSSLWCDKHAVGCQVSNNRLLRVPHPPFPPLLLPLPLIYHFITLHSEAV